MKNNNISGLYKKLNILCVEDDENVLETYKSLFSLIFKEVYFATNGTDGFACFKKEDIDIVLTDYAMPQENGLQMSRKIREIDASIPIIMVTALESIEMLKEALDLHITSFLKKPFTSSSLFATFDLAVKSVIVDRHILKEQNAIILYSSYQENLTFQKEKTIAKNDLEEKHQFFHFHCELFYQPKDTLSGDSYIIKKIDEDEYLIFLIDGMGKGISASVTAMLCSSFVNYYIKKIIEGKKIFFLKDLLDELLNFISENLLEDEVISADFFHFDNKKQVVNYAIFSMPPVLYMLTTQEIFKIKSNNTPLAAYTQKFQINTLDISQLSKMIIYSDGLNENSLENSQDFYGKYLSEDFQKATTMKEFEALRSQKVQIQEDDITYIFIQATK